MTGPGVPIADRLPERSGSPLCRRNRADHRPCRFP